MIKILMPSLVMFLFIIFCPKEENQREGREMREEGVMNVWQSKGKEERRDPNSFQTLRSRQLCLGHFQERDWKKPQNTPAFRITPRLLD